MEINVEGKRGRSKNKWMDMIENMRAIGVCVEVIENRDEWKFKTKVFNPKQEKDEGQEEKYFNK